jgi:hypothetical protein
MQYVSMRQHTIRQHASAYISIRQIGAYQQHRVARAQKKKNKGKEKINILACQCLFKDASNKYMR